MELTLAQDWVHARILVSELTLVSPVADDPDVPEII